MVDDNTFVFEVLKEMIIRNWKDHLPVGEVAEEAMKDYGREVKIFFVNSKRLCKTENGELMRYNVTVYLDQENHNRYILTFHAIRQYRAHVPCSKKQYYLYELGYYNK